MPNCIAALDDILSLAALNPAPRDQIQIAGTDPVLASNFFIGTAGSAAIAATGLAAANLWQEKTGRVQSVSIDVRRAAMAMRSDRFVHRDGERFMVGIRFRGSTKPKMVVGFNCTAITRIIATEPLPSGRST